MGFKYSITIISAVILLLLKGCGADPVLGKNGNFRLKDAGPDEFAVLPTKELELPDDFKALPEPTPNTRNRVDLTPQHDAVAALGGNPKQLDSTAVGAGEQALVAAASKRGTSENIRQTLAQEDEVFINRRSDKIIRNILYPRGKYLRGYRDQALDAREELDRLRSRGVRTPAVR